MGFLVFFVGLFWVGFLLPTLDAGDASALRHGHQDRGAHLRAGRLARQGAPGGRQVSRHQETARNAEMEFWDISLERKKERKKER